MKNKSYSTREEASQKYSKRLKTDEEHNLSPHRTLDNFPDTQLDFIKYYAMKLGSKACEIHLRNAALLDAAK